MVLTSTSHCALDLTTRLNKNCRPQLARMCYLDAVAVSSEFPTTGMHAPPHVKHDFNSRKTKIKSRGRGGRKLGKRAQAEQQVRQKRLRRGELRSYTLTMVRRESDADPLRDGEMARVERALWDDLAAFHLDLSFNSTDEEVTRNLYAKSVIGRLVNLQQQAARDIGCTRLAPAAAEHRLHAWRRQLAILHQELELLTFDSAQSRVVGEDGAFIAVGRSVKIRAFRAYFGWWTADKLLAKYDFSFSNNIRALESRSLEHWGPESDNLDADGDNNDDHDNCNVASDEDDNDDLFGPDQPDDFDFDAFDADQLDVEESLLGGLS